jgi:hypothetical protein
VTDFGHFLVAAGGLLGLGWIVVYPWQIIGLLRTCDRYLAAHRDFGWTTASQRVALIHGTVALSLLLMVMTGHALLQRALTLRMADAGAALVEDAGYRLALSEDGRLITLDGSFAPGLSRDLRALLAAADRARGILLESAGGRVYEARGVARLMIDHGLDSYVDGICKSACTIAYVGGGRRYLGPEGQLGFHQYRLETRNPVLDVEAEQGKDRAFFAARGVAAWLLARIFDARHDAIWYPSAEELLRAKVVHRIQNARAALRGY